MDTNYRNTVQIVDFAQEVVAECVSRADHDRQLVARLRAVEQDVATGWGDIGVLAVSSFDARRLADLISGAGIPVVELQKYDGDVVDAVKVGTIKRAKGLEFKQVCLVGVRGGDSGGGAAPEGGAERERWELLRRELFVGMTRARDGLWVGCVQ